MTSYVRAMYDFAGEPGSSEISLAVGDILAVTRTDVGEGWWEGKNNRGSVGLFPAAYVEVMSAAEVQQTQQNVQQQQAQVSQQHQQQQQQQQQNIDDDDDVGWDDDDWDDDNDTYSEIAPVGEAAKGNYAGTSKYDSRHLPAAPGDGTSIAAGSTTGMSTLRKSSMFGKSSDSYILGHGSKDKLPENEIVKIYQMEDYYVWQASNHVYTVAVTSPKKETKFKGMKTFMAYRLTPSFNNVSVARRYKHFDWLHERLQEKFCLIPIPPLPDKQISGRYEDQFVEHRRVQLQEFVDWVCRHPVLSKCEVWHHFLTCTDDKAWKSGKRKAERDPFVGFTYCLAIQPPEKHLLQTFVDGQINDCAQFTHAMDSSVRNLFALSNESAKRYQTQYKKEFQRLGDAFCDTAKALNIDERRVTVTGNTVLLSERVARAGAIFINLGQLYADQPKQDWIPFSDRLHIYRGILSTFPDILSTHKSAIQKRKECDRLVAEQKMNNAQLIDVNRRTDVISYALLAEMSHFKQERDTHFMHTFKSLIAEQIRFYAKIVEKLQEAHRQFD